MEFRKFYVNGSVGPGVEQQILFFLLKVLPTNHFLFSILNVKSIVLFKLLLIPLPNTHITLLCLPAFSGINMAAPTPPEESGFDTAKLYVWIKGVESKVNTLVREVDVLKNDYIKKHNDLKRDLKIFNDDILTLKRAQDQAQQKMDLVIKELKQTAGVGEVSVLKKYIEYWNPLNFVTQKDLDRVVQAKLASLNQAESFPLSTNNKNHPNP